MQLTALLGFSLEDEWKETRENACGLDCQSEIAMITKVEHA